MNICLICLKTIKDKDKVYTRMEDSNYIWYEPRHRHCQENINKLLKKYHLA